MNREHAGTVQSIETNRSFRWWWSGLWLHSYQDAFAEERSRVSRWAMPLSLVVHGLLLIALIFGGLWWGRPMPTLPQPMEVDLVPAPVKAPEPPRPEPPKPPLPKPEPPKPEPPKPDVAKPEPPPPSLPLQRPQLVPGKLAEHSSAPKSAAHNGAEGTSHAMVLAPSLSLGAKGPAKAGPEGTTGHPGPELAQDERDFVLSQVMKFWHVDFHDPRAHGLVLRGTFYINADGTLASPVNKNDPWNPGAVVDDYASLAAGGYSYRRETIDGFLMALRLCQPLDVSGMKGPWPRQITIHFAFDSM